MRLTRTWMFVPGSDEKKIAKAARLPADTFIYDLEDAVAVGEKIRARQVVKQALLDNVNSQAGRYVRVNAVETPWFEADVQEVLSANPTGIVLPKADGKEAIERVTALLERSLIENPEAKDAVQEVEIVPLIESARGLYHAYEIACACKRIKRLMFGAIDFALDISAQITKGEEELLYARSQLVVASRAAGIEAPIDSVYPDFSDLAGLIRQTQRARQLGFAGKLVIHPIQLAAVQDVFTPTSEELAEASGIVTAFSQGLAQGMGSVQVSGKMVDYPVYERAKRMLEQNQVRQASGKEDDL
ncbi:HpcH/HpaI aldolase/citrate lyase family protein [Brevibacillus sp. NRS-1366]|uniref:HpcH/HpaI aldolase/citrate lyase family protein n=1 Tax=Brevibacillus sp. NRS-1366 TaxID=3233899 RepID=UPI003D253905